MSTPFGLSSEVVKLSSCRGWISEMTKFKHGWARYAWTELCHIAVNPLRAVSCGSLGRDDAMLVVLTNV